MVIKEVVLERIPSKDSVIYINKSGISFSAAFIRKQDLIKAEGVKFFLDDEDPYYLGFRFVESISEPNTLRLVANGRSKGRSAGFTVKASELMRRNPVIAKVSQFQRKLDRTFEASLDKNSNLYFAQLKPCFEISVSWEAKSSIPQQIKGIYRYLNKENQVIYIGKGDIRARADSPERRDWQIRRIEYSVIPEEAESFFWEDYYITRHQSDFGSKPVFNLIAGHSSST